MFCKPEHDSRRYKIKQRTTRANNLNLKFDVWMSETVVENGYRPLHPDCMTKKSTV